MGKIRDIKVKSKKSIIIEEDFVLKGTKIKSPHVLDLKKKKQNRHEHPDTIKDLKSELTSTLTSKKTLYQEKADPRIRIASRFTEMARMAVLGTLIVFVLNAIGVYYEGIDVKEQIASAAYSSYESLLQTGPSEEAFNSAESVFEEAQQSLWFLQNQRAELLSQNKTAASVSHLLNAGEELSEAGAYFMAFVEKAQGISEDLLKESTNPPSESITEQLKNTFENDFKIALSNLEIANNRVQEVSVGLFPESLQSTILEAQFQLNELAGVFNQFNELFPIFLRLLGDEHPQRYLVLLENNHESRPGGGFIGSYLIIDINDGYLDGMSFNDVYEIDGQYYKNIEPPGEIASLTTEWRFRDSNYSPDLTVSAAKGAWFLEEEGGPGVDHVITMDLEFVNRLLEVIGPVKIDELPMALTKDNFDMVISYLVESKYAGEESPKSVLGSFIESAQDKLREKAPWLELGQLIQEMAQSKHISAYSKTEHVQDFFEEWGMSGAISTPVANEDYFALIHTSIGGNKTDAYMTQDIEHQTILDSTGLVHNQVTVTREHQFDAFAEAQLNNLLASFGFENPAEWVIGILGNTPNISIFRLYVPHGSTLISSSGIEEADIALNYDEDLGLDYFYFTDAVYPDTKETFTLTYELPYKLDYAPLDEYRLNIIKQPGDTDTTFTKIIAGDTSLTHYSSYPEELIENAHQDEIGVYEYEFELDQDVHLAQLWGR
ncbi:DUF4012 domain-containing protein [Candidatus Peregrinibacteria bacterium]|jgi:hypothetical protein|nr:DUF4012 domain-containing protein [Candidatus Peregrinibacteria bacterium]MBT7484195.1 DUF4012 domain-containing protein [Candidatus Peregrinibacteria bacterium]MBT7703161.1 DUF4012 domain-containing protein [Candidatus Peregrinibacteria bacterium]